MKRTLILVALAGIAWTHPFDQARGGQPSPDGAACHVITAGTGEFRFTGGDNPPMPPLAAVRPMLAPIVLCACLALPVMASAGVSVDADSGRLSIRGLGGGGPLREAVIACSGRGTGMADADSSSPPTTPTAAI